MKNKEIRKSYNLFTTFCFLLELALSSAAGAMEVTDDVLAELSLGDLLNLDVSMAIKTEKI